MWAGYCAVVALVSHAVNIENDTKKRELLKDPTKIEEIQGKKSIDGNFNHYNLPFKRQ